MSEHKNKILIVDDEANIHYSFKKILPGEYRIISAQTAEEGIEKLKKDVPDIVVMDIKLPGMDGLEALKTMRGIDARIPVIMMTAFGTVTTAITAMKFGAYEYLLKPFDILLISLSAMIICFLATLYPAHQAAKVNPVEAIRYG